MPTATSTPARIYHETFGDAGGPPLLLVAGLGMQLVGWDREWFDRLAAEGYYVVAYDNRDVGLSRHFDEAGMPDLLALLGAGAGPAAYRLADMAEDAAGLLDELGIAAAHVVGISMGGMIAQQLAIDHPERVLSLCSIMSTTGAPGVGQPTEEAARELLQAAPTTADEAADAAVHTWKIIGSPGFPFDEERTRRQAVEAFERAHDPAGVARQLAAILVSPDRTAALGAIAVPTVVIHGAEDPLVQPSGGEATAAAVPGARLVMIEGMGHSLPVEVWDQVVGEIVANTEQAATS